MSEIIEFPTQRVRDWAAIESALIPILRAAEIPQAAQTELLSRMKAFTELVQVEFSFSIPASCFADVKGEIDRFTLLLHERSNGLIMERLYHEIEVLRLRGFL